MAAQGTPANLVRLGGGLLDKLRVLAIVRGESQGAILERMAGGAIEAEFAKLPKDVQKLAQRPRRKAVTQ